MFPPDQEKPRALGPVGLRWKNHAWVRTVAFIFALTTVYMLGSHSSTLAAQLADPLRSVLGNQAVARLETWVFDIQDRLHQLEYTIIRRQSASPWQDDSSPLLPAEATSLHPTQTAVTSLVNPVALTQTPKNQRSTMPSEASLGGQMDAATKTPEGVLTSAPTPVSIQDWQPQAAVPLGAGDGEGIWTPYILDSSGRTVAARTFLLPDPQRLFAYVAVVAFDLSATQLHFVIGFDEPSEKGGPKGEGIIPQTDFQAGILLAAFNGGFQSTHGAFGAMQDGFVPVPPLDGAATVAIDQDGSIQIGEWGQDLENSAEMVAYRQNCQMVIHDGEINPEVFNNSITDWGGTVDNHIATWRSGLGISADANTLYYFVGPSLSMPALADAMLAAGSYQSMLLDINAFWVHFVAIRSENGIFTSDPLLPKAMIDNVDRFLKPFPRDFFYITQRR